MSALQYLVILFGQVHLSKKNWKKYWLMQRFCIHNNKIKDNSFFAVGNWNVLNLPFGPGIPFVQSIPGTPRSPFIPGIPTIPGAPASPVKHLWKFRLNEWKTMLKNFFMFSYLSNLTDHARHRYPVDLVVQINLKKYIEEFHYWLNIIVHHYITISTLKWQKY